MFNTNQLYSRAGGGGGRSHSSSHSSSSHHSSSHSSNHSGRSSGTISGQAILIIFGSVIGILVLAAILTSIRRKTNNQRGNGNKNKSDSNKPIITTEFMNANPGFNKEQFKSKVKIAFLSIQEAWSQQNLSKVRNWISDGIYQRFNLQFEMMKQLEQKNLISNVTIQQIKFVKAYVESNFSVITIEIHFKMDDKFISEKMKHLNENYTGEEAMEYWTFIKKSGAIDKDLYSNNSCPNCGNELNKDGGEVSKCPSCSTVTYLGDYDWVLSEITQEDDYEYDNEIDEDEINKLTELKKEEEFCIQNMEDKASNAFVHYLFASAWNESSHFKRFATDKVIDEINSEKDEPYIYNRIYLNSVTYSECTFDEDTHHLNFIVVYSAQKVQLKNNDVKEIDEDVETYWGGLTLSRKAGVKTKSRLWSHECPNCGAPYNDSTSSSCSYCNAKINSPTLDWVVTSAHKQ